MKTTNYVSLKSQQCETSCDDGLNIRDVHSYVTALNMMRNNSAYFKHTAQQIKTLKKCINVRSACFKLRVKCCMSGSAAFTGCLLKTVTQSGYKYRLLFVQHAQQVF